MARFAQISYNIHCNFTNYGSALQTWALAQVVRRLRHELVLVDYCPQCLKDKDPLNPMKNMWDIDAESRLMCELSMPAIRVNLNKFKHFYRDVCMATNKKYDSSNFDQIVTDEKINGFLCGSDTIFCIDEFGFDDGYYANYPSMRNGYSIAFAASFGDSHFSNETLLELKDKLQNFKAIAIREIGMLSFVQNSTTVPVMRVLDPTLLVKTEDFDQLAVPSKIKGKYLLLYARRYNQIMFDYAEKIATERNLKIVDISLRATNADKHIMAYSAGVEEFLGLSKGAEVIVTNSYHGMIIAMQYSKEFYIFSREQCDTKIDELLNIWGIEERKLITGEEVISPTVNFQQVRNRMQPLVQKSLDFLQTELNKCNQ